MAGQVVDTEVTREELRDLYAASDAFVLATRGEGWCLPAAEAMAMELPTIITNFLGNTEFAKLHTALLVQLRVWPPIHTESRTNRTAELTAREWARAPYFIICCKNLTMTLELGRIRT